MRSTARTYALPARLLPLLVWGLACSIEPAQATGDPLGQHHSTGTQITPANVDTLAPAWTHRNGDMAATQGQPSSVSAQSTPILLPPQAGEHLVYCTPFNRVIALDPRTGRERWTYDPQVRRTSERPYRCRGVAYAEVPQAGVGAACRHRIYTATNDRRLVALDARDGKPCDGFGARGVVTLAEHERYGLEQVSTSSPPVVANGVVVVGSSVIDFAYAEAPRGVIAAFDAVTGAPRWTFDPLQGINGTGAANAWAPLAVDAERDLVFVPTGAPSPDYYGVLREGSNGHANAVVALRLATGEVAWAFQLVHHDLWDYDTPAQPVLFEWTAPDGRRVPALAQVSKQGFVFVLDRRDGTPLLPVQERAVPASTIAGERAWPTQPFPQESLRLLPTRVTPNDAWGLTFWDRGQCRETLAGLRNEGIFTPLGEQPTLLFPGSLGGANWGGGAYSPSAQRLIVNVNAAPFVAQLIRGAGTADEAGPPGGRAEDHVRHHAGDAIHTGGGSAAVATRHPVHRAAVGQAGRGRPRAGWNRVAGAARLGARDGAVPAAVAHRLGHAQSRRRARHRRRRVLHRGDDGPAVPRVRRARRPRVVALHAAGGCDRDADELHARRTAVRARQCGRACHVQPWHGRPPDGVRARRDGLLSVPAAGTLKRPSPPKHDPPRRIPWPLLPVSRAATAHEILPDGRIHLTIRHPPLPGVTPGMLAWWYRVLPISEVEFDGALRPMYHLFHPTEHGRIWVEAPAADGQPGVGAGGVVARFEWFGPYDSEGAARVIELSPQRFVTRPQVAGIRFGEIRHEWGVSPQGATYAVDTIIGVDWPLIGPWINALLRRHLFSDGMLREWQRHQVEEVGLLPHFLPALYAQRNDRNIYRLNERGVD